VDIAIMGERELALGLLEYTLQNLGVSEERTHLIVQQVRKAGEGGAFERRFALEPTDAPPELQPRRDTDDVNDAS
jgi:CPA2 family monovalent cation:H+ antiporter-2